MTSLRTDPDRDCRLCPRLVEFRVRNREHSPEWFNAPVPSFGPPDARLLIVGLAPGLRGANRTGRPFTGDYAGDLLYATLLKFGFAEGTYDARPGDSLRLTDCMITNAVRCVPPGNKPAGHEMTACRPFLTATIGSLKQVGVILALGRIAHENTLSALGMKRSHWTFAHNAAHDIRHGLALIDSYHCSRYNTSTGRLTGAMFEDVFTNIRSRVP